MGYNSYTKEWKYYSEEKTIVWKSFFPEYTFDPSEFGIAFFYSPYYSAESNNIEVRMKDGTSIGWLITLSFLQEQDETLIAVQNKWLKNFAQIGICLLIQHIVEKEPNFLQTQGDSCLSEVELPSCHLFVFRRSQITDTDSLVSRLVRTIIV